MKKIITIMVLGLMFASAAMADGPKYGFASRPSGNAPAGIQNVRVGVTPSTTISTYRSGSRTTSRSFAPSATPGNVSTGATVRTSRTVITRRKTTSRPGALSTDYSRNPSASIVTSTTSHSASSDSYGGRSSALGLSSSASANSGSYSGGGYSGGGSSSSVVYGRTSSSATYASSTGSSSSSSGPRSMPSVVSGGGNSGGQDGAITMATALGATTPSANGVNPGGNNGKGEVDGPIGDAILPLLLLMSLLAVYKWRFKR